MRKTLCLLTLLMALLATPLAAWAHDYWIMPQSFRPASGTLLEAAFVSGHKFFEGQGTPDVSRFRLFLRMPQGQELPLAISRVAAQESWVLAPMLGQGTYQLAAASTVPEYWTLTPEGMKPGGKGSSRMRSRPASTSRRSRPSSPWASPPPWLPASSATWWSWRP